MAPSLDKNADIQALQDEIDFWRTDAAVRLWSARIALNAEVRQNGYSERAADIAVCRLLPTLAAIRSAMSGDLHEDCEVCGLPLRSGNRIWPLEDGGAMHERCDSRGNSPYVYEGFWSAERIVLEIESANAALDSARIYPE